nr:hypothetical protein [Tanacetum cinerariifolium]
MGMFFSMGFNGIQWQYTQRARIAQSSTLPPIADEPASPVRDVSEGEACPTDSGFIADQDMATIAKSSTFPYDTTPRVTSPDVVEGSMQQTINELTALCTSLQRKHSELLFQIQAQKVEINKLNARVKILEDNQGVIGARSADDAPIKGRRIDEEEATVLVGGIDVPIGSYSILTVGPPVVDIHTGSDAVPTASLIVATATVVTPYSRRKEKEVMKLVEDFIPLGSNEEAERLKRKGFNLEQEKAKMQKTSEEVPNKEKSPEEIPKEKVKEMMQLVPIEEVYVQALQVKHPIID